MRRNDILDAREERAYVQESLIKTYKRPLLVTRVNMPGQVKDTQLTHKIFKIVEAELRKQLRDAIRIERLVISAEGPVMIRLLDIAAVALKKIAIAIEDETPLGRFVDLDVYDLNGKSISRFVLGYPERPCYLCEASAHECVRSQRHELEDLLTYMETEVMKVNGLQSAY